MCRFTRTAERAFYRPGGGAVSEQFFGWITGLGRDVQIISPQSVVEKYRSLLADLGKLYEENNLGV